MVFPTEKSHLLKPCLTSTDGSEAVLPRENPSALSPDSKALSFSLSFCGWRFATIKFRSWAKKMAQLHEPTWRKAGIFESVMASTYKIHRNTDLLLGIAEIWCHDTKTFVFPWGETTLTLEDVMVLLGFSVLGLPVFAKLDSSREKTMAAKLEKEWLKIKEEKVYFVTQVAWLKRFMDSGDELEHVAFLSLWLTYFVFPSCYYHIYEGIFPIAVHLSSGTRMALAPAVLAHLYAELSLLKNHIRDFNESAVTVKTDLTALFKLVQVWIWERFREIQPKPNPMLKGEPRLARWSDLKQRTNDARRILENSKTDNFEWRPYTRPVKNWEFPKFYPESEMWVLAGPNLDDEMISFFRCIKVSELVGIDCVEHYFPNRVTSQFGMLENVPAPLDRNNLSKEEAWDDYNKPIDDIGFYIPSRSAIPHVSPTFYQWWRKSVPEFQSYLKEKGVVQSAETLESRTIIGDDTVYYGMKIPGILTKRRPKYMMQARRKRRKYIKLSHQNDVSTMGTCQIQVLSDIDDGLTIAQFMRLKNKKNSDVKDRGGDTSEQLGKRSRLEEDNNGLGTCQKLASIRADGDESVPSLERKQRNEDTDETRQKTEKGMALSPFDVTNSSDPPAGFDGTNDMVESAPEMTRILDDGLNLYGSNTEKMTLIDDDREDKNCLLHGDSAMRSCAGEKAMLVEKLCSEAEKEDGDRFIQKKLAVEELVLLKSDNNDSNPCKKLASGGSNGDETCKAGKSKILSPSQMSNNHIAVRHGTKEMDCLFLDNGLGSEESMKASEQLENLERKKDDVGEGDVGNDAYEKRWHKLMLLASSIEEGIIEVQRKVAWLKERRAIKQRKIVAACLI